MKKPNLTAGEWYYDMVMNEVRSKNEDLLICDIHYYGDDLEEEAANAKAIEQVPNIIDELIDAYYVLKAQVDSWGERRKHHDMYANMKSIEKVLISAGCSNE